MDDYFFFNTQRSFSQATLAIVMPLTSHFDSPQTDSQGTSGGFEAGTALHVQQSAKIVQSSVFLHSGPLGSGSASALDAGAVSVFGASLSAFGVASLAVGSTACVAAESGAC